MKIVMIINIIVINFIIIITIIVIIIIFNQEVQAKMQRYYKLAPKVKSLQNVLEVCVNDEKR